jgi:hypothetical protein
VRGVRRAPAPPCARAGAADVSNTTMGSRSATTQAIALPGPMMPARPTNPTRTPGHRVASALRDFTRYARREYIGDRPIKGEPVARRGRKATGLSQSRGSRAAERRLYGVGSHRLCCRCFACFRCSCIFRPAQAHIPDVRPLDKGKPVARRGRKAAGLRTRRWPGRRRSDRSIAPESRP